MTYEVIEGDCLDVMRGMADASVDAVITDPPYGIGKADWDGFFPRDWFYEARRVAKPDATFVILTGAGKEMREAINLLGPLYRATFAAWLCNGMTMGHISYGNWIAVNIGCAVRHWKQTQDVIRVVVRPSEKVDHPSPKPPGLMREVIRRLTEPGQTVLDPFTGSGTTGLACVEQDRHFIGIEREGTYAEIARNRIAAAQPALVALGA